MQNNEDITLVNTSRNLRQMYGYDDFVLPFVLQLRLLLNLCFSPLVKSSRQLTNTLDNILIFLTSCLVIDLFVFFIYF